MIKISKVGLSKKIFVVSLLFVIVLIFFVYHNTKIVKANDVDTALATYLAAAQKDPHNYYCGGMDWGTYQITAPFWWECHPVYVPKNPPKCDTGQALVAGICTSPKNHIHDSCSYSYGPNTAKKCVGTDYNSTIEKDIKDLKNHLHDLKERGWYIVKFKNGQVGEYEGVAVGSVGISFTDAYRQANIDAQYYGGIDSVTTIHSHPQGSADSMYLSSNGVGYPPSGQDFSMAESFNRLLPGVSFTNLAIDSSENIWQFSVSPDSTFAQNYDKTGILTPVMKGIRDWEEGTYNTYTNANSGRNPTQDYINAVNSVSGGIIRKVN